jgi:GMP synthase-like glutamine amidotransferase
MKKVHIVGGSFAYHDMFMSLGYQVIDTMEGANLVCFTGGEDVNPSLYGHEKHPTTYFSIFRDTKERSYFEKALDLRIPMVGICRGGQFLNVMSGGEMYQDVSNHTYDHIIIDRETGETVWVSSTHHQMMKPAKNAIIIATAEEGGWRVSYDPQTKNFVKEDSSVDYEVLYYPSTKALCFQPHPEFGGYDNMRRYFAGLLNKYLGV